MNWFFIPREWGGCPNDSFYKRKDIAATAGPEGEAGEYITKRVILEMYDQMTALGVHEDADHISEFDTWLSPEPASPAVAHPPRE